MHIKSSTFFMKSTTSEFSKNAGAYLFDRDFMFFTVSKRVGGREGGGGGGKRRGEEETMRIGSVVSWSPRVFLLKTGHEHPR